MTTDENVLKEVSDIDVMECLGYDMSENRPSNLTKDEKIAVAIIKRLAREFDDVDYLSRCLIRAHVLDALDEVNGTSRVPKNKKSLKRTHNYD